MKDLKSFLKVKRATAGYRPVCERIKDYQHVSILRPDEKSQEQTLRCMDCGTPFCHFACPVGNYIPEWNDLVTSGQWARAFKLLDATNNLPEITGRLCPALCEYSCVLGVNDDPVTIRENELAIIEHAFKNNIVKIQKIKNKTGKKIAVIGSGPAGLAVSDQLNRAGHNVVVFEKYDRPGGILRYGIPDFKLEKWIIDRRVKLLQQQGIKFKTKVNVGEDYPASKLKKEYDAIVLAGGSRVARDLNIKGRNFNGIYFAMDYLIQSNRRIKGEKIKQQDLIDAKGKKVVIIGGGDTGADCVGTANRQGAACVVQIEVMPTPPDCRTSEYPWPKYPLTLKTTSSHEEGAERHWSVLTKEFIGEKGTVKKIKCAKVDFQNKKNQTCPFMREVEGSEFFIEADIVILAIGFLHPEHSKILLDLKVKFDKKGNILTNENFMTSSKNVFAAGDTRRGQSLIVWAVSEGRKCAYAVDKYIMGKSYLPNS